MMKINPLTGLPEKKENPEREIEKSIIRTEAPEAFTGIRYLTKDIIIAETDNGNYLLVHLNGRWNCCGVIRNISNIMRHSRGPLINFHRVWANGFTIDPEIIRNVNRR